MKTKIIGAMAAIGALAAPAFLSAASPASGATLKTCSDRGYDDLKAKHVDCGTARSVYKRSLKVARRDGTAQASPTSATPARGGRAVHQIRQRCRSSARA
jgi:hypothetical protein